MWLVSPNNNLRTFNNFLTVAVVGLGLYIALLPFFPHFQLWIANFSDNTGGVRYSGLLAEENNVSQNLSQPPGEDWIVIPGIQVDEPVVVGDNPSLVHSGVWHRPRTSTPDQGGNTVLVGHRFSYDSPAVFYHLDKVAVGDTFAVWWQGTEYVYEVFATTVVEATAIEIEANTTDPIMTLYTCTPVWTAKDRLVIRASLVNTEVLEKTGVASQ